MKAASALALRARKPAEPEPDLTALVVTHRAVRQDLRRLAACLSGAGGGMPAARASAISRYTTALLTAISTHHQGEAEVLWPVITAVAGQMVDLVPLADERQAIDAAAGNVRQALASVGRQPCAPGGLATSIAALRDMLDDHIAEEEAQVFPAMRRYLTAGAYRWCQRQACRTASLPDGLFTWPWLARYALPGEHRRLLPAGGWQARTLLAVGRPRYARLERQAFAGHDRAEGDRGDAARRQCPLQEPFD